MRAIALAEYTTAGATAGAIFTGVGATLCHLGAPDRFHRADAAVAGLLGGAVTHATLGILAAFDHDAGHDRRYARIGASLPLAALTSGVLGGAILGAAGYPSLDPAALVLSGILGGATVAAVASLGTILACLTCAQRPRWTEVATGDLGQGESLIEEVPRAEHTSPPRRTLAERILPWERRGSGAAV